MRLTSSLCHIYGRQDTECDQNTMSDLQTIVTKREINSWCNPIKASLSFVTQRDGQCSRGDPTHGVDSNPWHCKDFACSEADLASRSLLFFHGVPDVEIERGRAEWHAPATRSCAGLQTSLQWHPPHECLVGARAGDRGCHCSLWSQPSWVNLADREYKHIYTQTFIYLSKSLRRRNIQLCSSCNISPGQCIRNTVMKWNDENERKGHNGKNRGHVCRSVVFLRCVRSFAEC